MDPASRASKALEARDYPTAIKELTTAIQGNSRAVKYYIQRSTAHQRSGDPHSALADAEIAVKLAVDRANRELIAEAQLQRGKALFALERYADAEYVFNIVKAKNPKEKTVGIWEAKVQTKLKSLAAATDNDTNLTTQATLQEVPSVHVPTEAELKGSNDKVDKGKGKETSSTSAAATTAPPSHAAIVPTPPNKIKHEWYQSTTHITLTILAKGVSKDSVTFDLTTRSLSLSFPTPNDSTYDFTLDPLFDEVTVADSSYKVMSTKIEISLKKTTPGRKWSTLEGAADLPATTPMTMPAVATGPSYPTSSKSGPKDWDKILKKPDEEKDDDEGDPQDFFKMLYAGASEETKRAMMKSYVESNGTALSTNWDEVKKGPVETSPPDGMVAKKWT